MTAYVICKIENLSPKFLPLPSRPARNPFPTLTKLPQLPVWLQRRIHDRILRLDSAKARTILFWSPFLFLQFLYWTNYIAMSGGTRHWAGVADRKGHIDRGCLLALSKHSPLPFAGSTATLFPGGQWTTETTILEKASPMGVHNVYSRTVQISSPTYLPLDIITAIKQDSVNGMIKI